MFRKGSGLTFRRLWVLIQGLPHDGLFWSEYRAANELAKTSVDRLRERQAHYEGKGGS